MKFNINDYIKVKLNDKGIQILKNEHDRLEKILKPEARHPFKLRVDEDGWYKEQAWSIFQTFGSHIHLCSEPPFETEIEIETRK